MDAFEATAVLAGESPVGLGQSGPFAADSPAATVLDIVARGRQWQRRVATALRSSGVSDTECLTLWAVGRCAMSPAQGELAATIGLSPAQLSAVVEQLRQRGLLFSERAPGDRRRQSWRLTPDGANRLDALLACVADECGSDFTTAAA